MKDRAFVLESERLILRPFEEKDEEIMLSILTNDEIKETYMIPDFDSREKVVDLFERYKELSLKADRIVYAICLRENCQLIGFLNDCDIDKEKLLCEIGYVISPKHKGNGYATEAFKTVIDELFRIGMKTIRTFYFEENLASCRVMEKCGLKPNGLSHDTNYRGKIHKSIGMEISK